MGLIKRDSVVWVLAIGLILFFTAQLAIRNAERLPVDPSRFEQSAQSDPTEPDWRLVPEYCFSEKGARVCRYDGTIEQN